MPGSDFQDHCCDITGGFFNDGFMNELRVAYRRKYSKSDYEESVRLLGEQWMRNDRERQKKRLEKLNKKNGVEKSSRKSGDILGGLSNA